jgi:hypothetical protein
VESPPISDFQQRHKNMHWRKDSLFNKWCWENCISTCRRLNQDPYLSPCTKINSKWTEDLSVRLEGLRLLKVNTGKTLEDTGIGIAFLNWTPIAQEIMMYRITNLLHCKGNNYQNQETNLPNGRKIFVAVHWIEEYLKYIKSSKNSTPKEQFN